jgi:hypothetical protein
LRGTPAPLKSRPLEPSPQGFDEPSDGEDALVLFAARRLGPLEAQSEDRELRSLRRAGVSWDGRTVDEILKPMISERRRAEAKARSSRAASRVSASVPFEQVAINRSRTSRVKGLMLLRPRGRRAARRLGDEKGP